MTLLLIDVVSWRSSGLRCVRLAMLTLLTLSAVISLFASTPRIAMAEAPLNGVDNAASLVAQSVQQTALFSDDFETYGDSTLWSNEHPFPVQSELVANGLFAARMFNFGGNPVYGRTSLPESQSRLFVRVRFQVVQLDALSATLVNFRAASASTVIAVRIDDAGRISYQTGATEVISGSSIVAEPGVWHELQMLVDISSDHENVRIWLDSAELTSIRQSVFLGDRPIRLIDLGDNSAGQQSDIAYDDIIVDNEFISADRGADPVPGRLVVNTFPAWGNIQFELDGISYFSDPNGVVEIPVSRWSTDLRSRIIVHDTLGANGAVATFTGWKNWYGVHSKLVHAAFQISEPVTITFVDPAGQPIDPTSVDSVTIKSDSGVIQTFTGEELSRPVLITISGVTSRSSGLETSVTRYVVDEVNIGGSNAVHRAQQRSNFETSREWTIPLLFYSVTFMARDAFFGSALGQEIVVQSADGSEQRIALDEHGQAVIPRLSRGEYSVVVVGAGYSPPRPIYVSRDQSIEMKVISPLDVASLLLVIGSIVAGLLIIGRPYLVTTPIRRSARAVRGARAWAMSGFGQIRSGWRA